LSTIDIPEIPFDINAKFEKILATRKDALFHEGTIYKKYIRCGKRGCKCNNGQPHGPYYYIKTSSGDKYLGKHLPDDFHQIRKQKTASNDHINSMYGKYQKILQLQRELRRLIADFVTEVENFDNFDKEVEI